LDLQTFVTSTLVQIVKGIKDAQDQLKGTGAIVNPGTRGMYSSTRDTDPAISVSGVQVYLKHVSFDVAITASDEQSAEAGAGVRVWGARLGADGKVSSENSTVSRVQFSVPVALPFTSVRDSQQPQDDSP
jgi:hypothetical protein